MKGVGERLEANPGDWFRIVTHGQAASESVIRSRCKLNDKLNESRGTGGRYLASLSASRFNYRLIWKFSFTAFHASSYAPYRGRKEIYARVFSWKADGLRVDTHVASIRWTHFVRSGQMLLLFFTHPSDVIFSSVFFFLPLPLFTFHFRSHRKRNFRSDASKRQIRFHPDVRRKKGRKLYLIIIRIFLLFSWWKRSVHTQINRIRVLRVYIYIFIHTHTYTHHTLTYIYRKYIHTKTRALSSWSTSCKCWVSIE